MNESYARRGYAAPERDYGERGYGDGGYDEGGYRERGYGDGGYGDGGYRERDYGDGGYRERDYGDGGYRERDYGDGGYRERGYAPERGYGDGGYRERGYAPGRGYDDGGYGDGGYGERGYAPERRSRERGYAPGRGYDDGGYGDGGYGERGYAPERRSRERDYAPGRGARGYAPDRRSREPWYAPRRARGERRSAKGAEKGTRTGGIMLGAISIFCTFMVLWGLYYATGTTERHKVALAAAECEPNLTSNNTPCVTVPMLVSEYASMTKPAIQQLNADVALYTTNESHDLAAAKAALSAEVTVADELLKSMAKFPFPPFATAQATATIHAIQARVTLMTEQARSSSLTQLRSFNARVDADAAVIRTDLKRLSKAVAHHPTPSQEPANVVGG